MVQFGKVILIDETAQRSKFLKLQRIGQPGGWYSIASLRFRGRVRSFSQAGGQCLGQNWQIGQLGLGPSRTEGQSVRAIHIIIFIPFWDRIAINQCPN